MKEYWFSFKLLIFSKKILEIQKENVQVLDPFSGAFTFSMNLHLNIWLLN